MSPSYLFSQYGKGGICWELEMFIFCTCLGQLDLLSGSWLLILNPMKKGWVGGWWWLFPIPLQQIKPTARQDQQWPWWAAEDVNNPSCEGWILLLCPFFGHRSFQHLLRSQLSLQQFASAQLPQGSKGFEGGKYYLAIKYIKYMRYISSMLLFLNYLDSSKSFHEKPEGLPGWDDKCHN